MARFKVVTSKRAGAASTNADYGYEMEALSGIDAEIVEAPVSTNEEFLAVAHDADAIYGKGTPITRAIIEKLERCKVIALGSVGVDSVDIAAATEHGIPVTNVPDTFIEEVADHVMTLLLGIFRNLVVQDRMVRTGRWKEGRPQLYKVPRLIGQTLGFIAFGHVARATARRARAFGLHMLAFDPFVAELAMTPYGVEPASLSEVLSRSDFVSMHAPAAPETIHMLRAEHFRQMKKSAFFINTGRGPTVDEPALIQALTEHWIAGAALDVLETEPPKPDNPLLGMGNVILTAHVASASARFDPARLRRVGRELALVLGGRWPMSCVNPAVLAQSRLRRWQPQPMERGPNG